jgi:hypothetical protein
MSEKSKKILKILEECKKLSQIELLSLELTLWEINMNRLIELQKAFIKEREVSK